MYFWLWKWILASRFLNTYEAVLTAYRLLDRLKTSSFCLQFMGGGGFRLILNAIINRLVFVAEVQCIFWEQRIDI